MNVEINVETHSIAVGGIIFLAVLLFTACSGNNTPAAAVLPSTTAATSVLTATPTQAPSLTVAPSATDTSPSAVAVTPTPTTLPSSTAVEVHRAAITPIFTATVAVENTVPTTNTTGLTVAETTITLPTYPYQDYLVEQTDPLYKMPVYYFNRPQFEADAPTPQPVEYSGVVLENPYLRLIFLPELGGRLYSAVVKSTGQEIFYHNPVVKPSRYGVLQPYEANWWLATGGMEWAYPVQEHGYRFGIPWDYRISHSDDGATITLTDVSGPQTKLTVQVTLPATSATFSVAPVFTNTGSKPLPVQLWTNAALALSESSMWPNTQFILPTQVITIHSRGEAGWVLPPPREQAPWPQAGNIDLRDYRQWANYLGFFVDNGQLPFIGATNPQTRLGVVRLVDTTTPGTGKLFAFGTGFTDRSYTDDESQYFEIWGGANAGFWPEDDILVAPGASLGWQESWWPLAGLPGLTWATADAAVHLAQSGDEYTLSALVSHPVQGHIQIMAADKSLLLDQPFQAGPDQSLVWTFTGSSLSTIHITGSNNKTLLQYQN